MPPLKMEGSGAGREGLGFRRNGVATNIRGLHPSYSEASLSLSSEQSSAHRRNALRRIQPIDSSSLVWESVILHLCSFYEKDTHRRQKLFLSICSSLSKMKLMSNTFELDELSALRTQYQKAFAKLIKMAQKTLDSRGNELPAPDLKRDFLKDESDLFHHSRFESDFKDVSFISKGGFGAVYKARNRLDNVHYAVKKIFLKNSNEETVVKILREVTTLAKLTHPNIVCYKTAWLEPLLEPSFCKKLNSTEEASSDDDSVLPSDGDETETKETRETEDAFKKSSDDQWPESSQSGILHSEEILLDGPSDDDPSIVFDSEFEIDDTDGKNQNRRITKFKTTTEEKLIRCKIVEVPECDIDCVNEIPTVIGQAATPPQTTFSNNYQKKLFKKTYMDNTRFEKRKVKSKFWIGASGDLSSVSKEDIPRERKAKSKTNEARMKLCLPLNTKDISEFAYGPHHILKKHERQLEMLFSSSLPTNEFYTPVTVRPNDKVVLYIQMQLCDHTLRSWLDVRNESCSQISHEMNQKIFRQILNGVEYIHSQGIIHRDLKPRNIFVSQDGKVQIGDFGLAKHELLPEVADSAPVSPLDNSPEAHPKLQRVKSQHTSGVGTQTYAAPEQLANGFISFKSDMYSLGIVLFELYFCFSTSMERFQKISKLREAAASGKSAVALQDLEISFPAVKVIIENLLNSKADLRPNASQLLGEMFGKLKTCPQSKPSVSSFEIENFDLKAQIQTLESELANERDKNRAQESRIRQLEKLLAENI